jgi:hypothetical protein
MDGHEVPPDQPVDAAGDAQQSAKEAASPPPWLGFETESEWRGLRRRRGATPQPEAPRADESPAEGFAVDDGDATVTERPNGRG